MVIRFNVNRFQCYSMLMLSWVFCNLTFVKNLYSFNSDDRHIVNFRLLYIFNVHIYLTKYLIAYTRNVYILFSCSLIYTLIKKIRKKFFFCIKKHISLFLNCIFTGQIKLKITRHFLLLNKWVKFDNVGCIKLYTTFWALSSSTIICFH